MLLRDDTQVALNDVESRSLESADHYAAAVHRTEDDTLALLMSELAELRRQQAAELAAQIRAAGDLPKAPDQDRQDMRDLMNMIRPLLTGDERVSLISEREQAEDKLADAVDAALAVSLSREARSLLIGMQSSVHEAKRRLAEHRPA